MKQTSEYAEEVKRLLANPGEQREEQEPDTKTPAVEPLTSPSEEQEEIYDVYTIPGGVVIVRADETAQAEENIVIESTPGAPPPQKPSYPHIYALSFVYLFLLLSILIMQIWLLVNPPIATITIVAKSQQITLTGTLQLGRLIAPITLSQTQTTPTTGKGHQDARSAVGTLTFYNGLFTSQSVPAGRVFTGANGVQVATDETVTIPPNNPPVDGQATVSAHALNKGAQGNIRAGDIDVTISNSVLVRNSAFHSGQDERDFRTVTTNDLNEVATSLKTTLAQSMQAALQSQSESGEALLTPPCTPTVSADHHVGEEAVQLKVTVSETCSAVAYNSQELRGKVTNLLTHQAVQTVGTGYSRLGDVQITTKQATVAPPHRLVFLSFVSQGTWVYALTSQEQQYIKELIAGKSKRNALQLLQSLPGIQSASIVWNEQTKLPNDINAIHFVIIVEA